MGQWFRYLVGVLEIAPALSSWSHARGLPPSTGLPDGGDLDQHFHLRAESPLLPLVLLAVSLVALLAADQNAVYE